MTTTNDAAAREHARKAGMSAEPPKHSEPAPTGQPAHQGEARSLDAVTPGGAPYKTRQLGGYRKK